MAVNKTEKRVYERQAEIIRAVAQPVRIAILEYLKDGEQCVCDIADFVGAERSNVSKHLAIMQSAGVLSQRKEGLKVIYAVKLPCILELLGCIRKALRQQARESSRLLKAL